MRCGQCGCLMAFGFAESPAFGHVGRVWIMPDGRWLPQLNKTVMCYGTLVTVVRPDVAAAYLLGGDLAVRLISYAEEAAERARETV